jgi:mono/diheme cytochrome c family protein
MSSKFESTAVVFCVLVFVTALTAWTVVGAAGDAGEGLYDDHCRQCHGSEGRGTTRGPVLVPFDWSYSEALELIRKPVCNMPPIPESELSDRQVAQIVAYLKSIK